jgi:(p)ppGpp synthase/HD superfamily hydrolase
VHTDVGNTCVAARIDRRLVPLRTRLHNGQTVEVIASAGAHPNPAWLDFVVTAKARANIRSYLKHLQHQEAEELGRRLLDRELQSQGSGLDQLPAERMQEVLKEDRIDGLERLLRDIGLGNRMPLLVARRLLGAAGGELLDAAHRSRGGGVLAIKGTEGMVVNFAKCCRPIPDDSVVGVFHPGKGLVVHRQGCKNLGESRKHGPNWVDLQWADQVDREFSSEIRVEVGNQRGALATVAATISELGSNIENVSVEERDGTSSNMRFLISVRDHRQLNRIMNNLRVLPKVMGASRE